jgi:predicted RNA-binding Zn-ribbon protein involved in translation (DUF1610 family)
LSRFAPSDRRRILALPHSFESMSKRRRVIIGTSVVTIEVPAAWMYECPVCGVELARSNFETPSVEYYCPVCTTRQMPRRWTPALGGEERP